MTTSHGRPCTGLAATWCPNHGDCECPLDGPDGTPTLDDTLCPLHGASSTHAAALPDCPPGVLRYIDHTGAVLGTLERVDAREDIGRFNYRLCPSVTEEPQ